MTNVTRAFTAIFQTNNVRPKGFLARLVKLQAIWVERQKLAHLDGNILNDIGKSREEAKVESKRAAWDAPSRWLR